MRDHHDQLVDSHRERALARRAVERESGYFLPRLAGQQDQVLTGIAQRGGAFVTRHRDAGKPEGVDRPVSELFAKAGELVTADLLEPDDLLGPVLQPGG